MGLLFLTFGLVLSFNFVTVRSQVINGKVSYSTYMQLKCVESVVCLHCVACFRDHAFGSIGKSYK